MARMTLGQFVASLPALMGLGLAACAGRAPESAAGGVSVFSSGTLQPPPAPGLTPPPRLGPAPDITNQVWLNSASPLNLEKLRGKVVLVEFWTFGCINCQRVIPWIRDWHDRYAGDDFEVVGVHYPEFAFEREVDNVVVAVAQFEIGYPVAIDNDGVTWRAYGQRYWPTRYLLDKSGQIRYKHIGEGAYAETEAYI